MGMIEIADRLNRHLRTNVVAPRTDRGTFFYNHFFGYSNRSLSGLTILDVGAGDSPFSQTVEEAGGRLVRLDAQYASKAPTPGTPGPAVVALAQEIPFRDGSFDETIASYSLYWIKAGLREALKEMLRVTKNGGLVKVHPVQLTPLVALDPSVRTYSPDGTDNPNDSYTVCIYKDPAYSSFDWDKVVNGLLFAVDFRPQDKSKINLIPNIMIFKNSLMKENYPNYIPLYNHLKNENLLCRGF